MTDEYFHIKNYKKHIEMKILTIKYLHLLDFSLLELHKFTIFVNEKKQIHNLLTGIKSHKITTDEKRFMFRDGAYFAPVVHVCTNKNWL